MYHALSIRRIAVLALVTGVSLCVSGSVTAAGTLPQEEQQGQELAESVRAGERECSDLSSDEFEVIGEYAMGRYLGDEGAHAAMNRRMTLMMGEAGERRMHMALGYRYSGCSGGPASGWVGPMAGMMSGHGAGAGAPGMMGGGEYGEGRNYPGSMMGSGGHGTSGIGTLGVVLIALAAAALGAGVGTLLTQRQQPRKDAAP